MSDKRVLLILVGNRKEEAKFVQQTLTGWGCVIKTRLGIHEDVLNHCSNHGLIICELVGDAAKHEELTRKLNLLNGVHAKLVELSLDNKPPRRAASSTSKRISQLSAKSAAPKPVAKRKVTATKK